MRWRNATFQVGDIQRNIKLYDKFSFVQEKKF